MQKKQHLQPYEKLLKRFKYKKALEAGLLVRTILSLFFFFFFFFNAEVERIIVFTCNYTYEKRGLVG